MPRTSGIYTLPPVYLAQPGTTIRSEQHNIPLQDIAAALTNSLPRDGQAPMTGDLPMGGRKVTGLGAATSAGDAVRFDQLPRGVTGWLAAVADLTMAANRFPYATGANSAALATLTAFGRSLIDDANAAAARNTLELGAAALLGILGQSVWNAGTSETEAAISPAKLRMAMIAQYQELLVVDQKAQGTSGGAAAGATWHHRDLTFQRYIGIPGASLAGNAVTLPAGVYYVEASAPAYNVGQHKLRLQNATANTLILPGTSEYSNPGDPSTTRSHVQGRFTLADETAVRLEHYTQTGNANGLGIASNIAGMQEIYTMMKIVRVRDS